MHAKAAQLRIDETGTAGQAAVSYNSYHVSLSRNTLQVRIARLMHGGTNLHKCKKLQFIRTVNGDGYKTTKIIKRQC